MNVKELKAVLAALPDDMLVLHAGGYDPSFRYVSGAAPADTEFYKNGYYEYLGEEYATPGHTVVRALVLRG